MNPKILLVLLLMVSPNTLFASPTLTLVTNPASAVTQTSAVVSGTLVSAANYPVAPSFVLPSGGVQGTINPSSISSPNTSFSATVTGLTCGTTYWYGAAGTDAAGAYKTVAGLSFKTLDCTKSPLPMKCWIDSVFEFMKKSEI